LVLYQVLLKRFMADAFILHSCFVTFFFMHRVPSLALDLDHLCTCECGRPRDRGTSSAPGGAMSVGDRVYNVLIINCEFSTKTGLARKPTARSFAEAGGLMSYGPSPTERDRQAGIYAARILKSEKQTADALGINVPATLRAEANEDN